MNEGKFFSSKIENPDKVENISPHETLAEAVAKMEEMDEENKKRGGKGTVVFKNIADKEMKAKISDDEKDPLIKRDLEEKND